MFRRALSSTIVIWCLIVACASSVHGTLKIVGDGRSDFCIVVPADAIAVELFAAEELATHVRQMSGINLRVVRDNEPLPSQAILLGNVRHLAALGIEPDWQELGKEGCLVRTTDNYLVIAGGRPRGTLYGVYTVLEKFWGCRWFAPDTALTPASKTLAVSQLNRCFRPAFEYREPWIYSGGGRGKWWANHFVPAYLSRTRNSSNLQKMHVFWDLPDRQEDFGRYGGNFDVVRFSHNHALLVPLEKYAKSHPEYYALRSGKRIVEGDIELCMSNPDVERIAADTLARWMRENPAADMFFVGQSDTDQYCECGACDTARRKYGGWDGARRLEIPGTLGDEGWIKWGGFAGLNIEFVNRIATRLESRFPHSRIGTFAYTGTQRPPRNITAHRNVVVWYCPTSADPPLKRCFNHSIERCAVNDDLCDYASEIRAWSRIARQIYVFDYSQLGGVRQPADLLALRDNVRAYRRLGVEGVLVDAITDVQAGFGFMRYWLWTQLLNDPDFDFERGLQEFVAAYYGAAGPDILQYIALVSRPDNYEALSEEVVAPWTSDPYRSVPYDRLRECGLGWEAGGRVLTDAAIDQGYEIFERATAAVADDAPSLNHVRAARMCLQHAMLELLPDNDQRLVDEARSFVALLGKFEMTHVAHLALDEYRTRLSKKLNTELLLPQP